jgi:hypothetical protein
MGEQPRRWMIGEENDGSARIEGLRVGEEVVSVREDAATPADVEAVAEWFAEYRDMDQPVVRDEDRAHAETLLAAVFPDSKAGN